MAHYWAANEDPRLRAAIAEDWLEDLSIFHEAIVGEACRDWRHSENKRPTPSDIRKICLEKTSVPTGESVPPRDFEAEARIEAALDRQSIEAEEAREKWARDCGCQDFREAIALGLAHVARRGSAA